MVRRSILPLAILALCAVAGCGGGGDKTFDVASIGITFKHPATFKPITNLKFGQTAGAKPTARAGVALDDVNAIIVSRYDLKVTITKDTMPIAIRSSTYQGHGPR